MPAECVGHLANNKATALECRHLRRTYLNLKTIGLSLVILGVLLLVVDYVGERKFPLRNRIATERDLTTITGTVVAAHASELKSKKGASFGKSFDLDIRTPDRTINVKLGGSFSEADVAALGGQTVTAAIDSKAQNAVYSLSAAGREVVSYARTVEQRRRAIEGESSGKWQYSVAIILGLGALAIHRKRQP
jgi:hypothetical protein